jgi:adenylate kinase
MVADRLNEADAQKGFLLDGYPRTIDQINELDKVLAAKKIAVEKVIELTVDIDAVVPRLLKRAAEQNRVDDTEDVIRRRLEVYAEQTAPLTEVYAQRGLLVQVDGFGEINEITKRLMDVLGL